VTKKRFLLGILKGLLAILMSGFVLLAGRPYIETTWGLRISDGLYQILIPVVLMLGVWIGADDFIQELIKEHKKKNNQR
jgi:hypothetical protein